MKSERFRAGRLKAFVAWVFQPWILVHAALFVGILAAGIVVRLHFAAFLDPFEDGYQNWWISANLLSTGQYWDRHSMMTQGNWLPLYHFFGSAVLSIGGLRNLDALKLANIVVSGATAVLLFQIGRKRSAFVGFAAMAFFSFNFIDVVVSGWSTAESLTTFLVLLGYASLFYFNRTRPTVKWLGAIAFALAVMSRYEAWLAVGLVALFAFIRRPSQPDRQEVLWVTAPAMAFIAGYFVYALQWGFLPGIVVNQTSTDIRYQLSVGTQPSPIDLLARWWSGYVWFSPLVLVLGGATAMARIRKDSASWIIVATWGFVLLYALFQFGNPSYRYVMVSVPFLSLFAATALESGGRHLRSMRFSRAKVNQYSVQVAIAASFIVVFATMLPAPATFWHDGFATSEFMEPLKRAGEFLAGQQLPEGKILISESPMAAYFSGFPADRILGSRWLPGNRTEAFAFLKDNAAYVVYMGVPYYGMRTLFPELQDGLSTPDFELLYDAGGFEAGTHAVYVYRVLSR